MIDFVKIQDVYKKLSIISKCLTNIFNTIKSHNPNVTLTLKDLDKVSEEIDNIIVNKTHLSYLDNINIVDNSVVLLNPIFKNQMPSSQIFDIKCKNLYISNENGTNILNENDGNVKFSYASYSNNKTLINGEDWKQSLVRIKSNNTIERFRINNSNCMAIVSNLNYITNLDNSFSNNSMLRTISLKNIDKVESANNIFANNVSLIKVDADFSKIKYADGIFNGCASLVSLELDLSSCISAIDMFKGCTNLISIVLLGTSIPNNLDFTDCKNMATTSVFNLLNSLPKNLDGLKNITFKNIIMSDSQKESYRKNGYNIIIL